MKRTITVAIVVLAAAAADAASFTVRVAGRGKPAIFIPGLSSPGDVWDGTCAHLAPRYQCHIITLAGFAGTKAGSEPLLPAARRDLAKYIRDNRLERPVIIGHSLGGFLAFWLASTEPDLVGPVVSVDGLPYAADVMAPGVPKEELAKRAEMMRASIATATAEQFAQQTEMSLSMMITGKDDLARVTKAAVQSDPPTVAEAMRFMLTTDIRADLARIKTPVLLIQPLAGAPDTMAEQYKTLYESQVAAAPDKLVVQARHARHFVMLDDPKFFFETLDAFLERSAR